MNDHAFSFAGAALAARADGALHWPARRLLVVSDLHLGKAERLARRGGSLLPPYATRETLERLEGAIAATRPEVVICLGDSFDDLAAASDLEEDALDRLAALQAGRRWIWIEGNHDPGPVALPGSHLGEYREGPLVFRHIARGGEGEPGEVSGHYHPKMRLALGGLSLSRPCFLHDGARLILPAFGTYTGGLNATAPALRGLLGPGAMALLTGRSVIPVPLPG